ncbi:MAG: DNA polymerase III subunit gamma/tau, partial [Pseudomonadota bacterium]
SEMLGQITRRRWSVVVSTAEGAPTLREARTAERAAAEAKAAAHPLVLAALETFPGARIVGVRPRQAEAPAAEDPEDWVEDPDASLLENEDDDDITTDPFEER